MLKRLTTSFALFASVIGSGCMQTFEEDYGFDQVAERCDNRLNRPVVSASANGSATVQTVNTQSVGCAGTARTFEIMSERSGG